MPFTSSRIGADEMTCSDSIVCTSPAASLYFSAHVCVAVLYSQPTTFAPMWILPPSCFVFSAHASHIMPGPLRGYLKELIRVLMTLFLSFGCFCGSSAFLIALPSEKP